MGDTSSSVTPSAWITEIAFPHRRFARTEWKYLVFASPSLSHNERNCCQLILALSRASEWISDVTPRNSANSASDRTSS
ncbi:hypothetical protein A2U01_0064292, partial [Trifolium medium]|nr:hypothetical protein [Trifolium medium]